MVAEEVGLIGEGRKDGADGVVGGDLLKVQLHGVDALFVDLRAVAGGWIVGVGLGQAREKRGLEGSGLLAEDLLRKLQHARGVGDDLHGLDAGDVVEEPAATGVHELGVALHLHQLEGAHALGFRERVRLMRGEEAVGRFRAAVENDLDVGVARGPNVFEEVAVLLLGERNERVAQLVEGLAQRRAPSLVPAGLAAVAAAIGAPALDAVHAAP